MTVCCALSANAQAQIKFDKQTHNFGSFPETEKIHKTTFTFTNVGDKPLIINQALAIAGGKPLMKSHSGLLILPKNWRA